MASKIVVLGAGVTGLTTALLLSKNEDYNITIVAKHMPGDYNIEYASPWAGADFVPPRPSMTGGNADETQEPFELTTWPELERLAKMPETGIHFQKAVYYRRKKDVVTESGKWLEELMCEDNAFRQLLPTFRSLDEAELPDTMDAGVTFTTVCINTALYLPWLASQCLKAGVVIKRSVISHIHEAANRHHTGQIADLVLNCSGLSSLWLGGVEDGTLFPSRGQTVLVRNDPGVIIGTTGTDDGPSESTYVMNRAGGGGCVLGGCSQKHDWNSQPDLNLAMRIMNRAVETCPQLVPPGKGVEGLDIIRHAVGLRPMRSCGIRIEQETIQTSEGFTPVVHNYGHGGAGYQTSYGAAKVAVALVEEVLPVQSKL